MDMAKLKNAIATSGYRLESVKSQDHDLTVYSAQVKDGWVLSFKVEEGCAIADSVRVSKTIIHDANGVKEAQNMGEFLKTLKSVKGYL